MVGTRLVYACLAVCALSADVTHVSAAGATPSALAIVPPKPAAVTRVTALPSAAAQFAMARTQTHAARTQAANSVPFGQDIGLKCLVAAMLVAYQLRRKHRGLRAQSFSQ
jgi:hypothetical protein